MNLTPITFVCAYYRNPGMLEEQQRRWRELPADIRGALHAVVTDDCSPEHPARAVVADAGLASYRLFRTQVDIRWNWLFARNLGASVALTDWLLLTDIDHVAPADTWRALMAQPLDPSVVYRFSRVDAPNLTPYKPHPNSWLLTGAMFDKIGGYDERFSGFYGTDADFRERAHATARAVVLRPEPLIRYPREVIADASTHPSDWRDGRGIAIERKTKYDGEGVARIRNERAQIIGWRPLRVTFPYRLEWAQGEGFVGGPAVRPPAGEAVQ